MTANEKLNHLIEQIEDPNLRKAVNESVEDCKLRITDCPASLGHHHAYPKGLIVHTVEVTEYALQISGNLNLQPTVIDDILIAAAICHDLHKTKEYVLRNYFVGQAVPTRHLTYERREESKDVWVYSDYGNKIHHIQGSFGCFMANAKIFEVNETVAEAVGHAILAHHGPVKEWGSPVKPQTVEAMILHQADCLSAFHGKTFYKEVDEKDQWLNLAK